MKNITEKTNSRIMIPHSNGDGIINWAGTIESLRADCSFAQDNNPTWESISNPFCWIYNAETDVWHYEPLNDFIDGLVEY